MLSHVSTRRILFNSLKSVYYNSFSNKFAIEFIILKCEKEPNIPSGQGTRNPPDGTILDS